MSVTPTTSASPKSHSFVFGQTSVRLAALSVGLLAIGLFFGRSNQAHAALLPSPAVQQTLRQTIQDPATVASSPTLGRPVIRSAVQTQSVSLRSNLGLPEELKGSVEVTKPTNPAPRTVLPRRTAYFYIVVDISQQRVWGKLDGVTIFTDLVSTGLTGPTPVGHYHVLTKVPVGCMSGPFYHLCDIHYIMYYDSAGRSTHEAYWHNNFGHPMSHGCVNMRYSTAKWFYEHSHVGTDIYIVA